MKTKTSFRRAALPIISVLAAAIISLTSVTFAWFTYGNTAKVEQINVNVESAGDLQISVGGDAFSWNSTVSPNVGNKALVPSSTNGVVSNGALTFYKADLSSATGLISNVRAAVPEGNNVPYITFNLYFKNTENVARTVKFTGTTVASSQSSHYASRIAVLQQDSKQIVEDMTPWDNDALKATSAQIYEPVATSHTNEGQIDYVAHNAQSDGTGAYAYRALSGTSEADTFYDRYNNVYYTKATGVSRPAASGDYYIIGTAGFRTWTVDDEYKALTNLEAQDEIVAGTNTVYEKVDGAYVQTEDEDADPSKTYYLAKTDEFADLYVKAEDGNAALTSTAVTTVTDLANMQFTLAKQAVTKVTFYIWLEGQDADCTNYISGYSLTVDFAFVAE